MPRQRPRKAFRLIAIIVMVAWQLHPGGRAHAQEHFSLYADVLFYGDNTEFRNPFREGETIFGAAARGGLALELGPGVELSLGAFGNMRFGSEDSFEQVRPVISLAMKRRRSEFLFGTLRTPYAARVPGPDRAGPHGLLPPIQRETLAFDRPYEAGLQWLFTGAAWQHDLWLNWQRLNTEEHRERFDAGANVRWRAASRVHLPFQFHLVHEGGQLFASGVVADSFAGAAGVELGGTLRGTAGALELFGLASRYVPDREAPERSRSGAAFLGRGSVERGGWRAHLLFFRGDDFIKDEGDPNYLSIRRNGTRYRGIRDYAETGVTRTFALAKAVTLEVSARLHRVERNYEYSYRVLASAAARKAIR
jgi:hypothetical protein